MEDFYVGADGGDGDAHGMSMVIASVVAMVMIINNDTSDDDG